MQALSHRIYRFNDFELDALKRQLLRRGQPVTLQPKAFDLLLALVENSGRLLTKDDLLSLVWPDQIVEESNLTVHMSALRKSLGEHKGEHRFVVTEPGRGYRFIADVAEGGTEAGDEEFSIESRTLSRIVIEGEIENGDGLAIEPAAETETLSLPATAVRHEAAVLAVSDHAHVGQRSSPTTSRRTTVVAVSALVALVSLALAFAVYRFLNEKKKRRAFSAIQLQPPDEQRQSVMRGHLSGRKICGVRFT